MKLAASQFRAYKQAIGLGTLAGLRSLSAPALLSDAANRGAVDLSGTPFSWLESPQAALGLRVLAGGEMIADKTPKIPARTSPGPLLGRAGLGALVGAAAFAAEDESPVVGAAIGALAAVVATFGAYKLRKAATDKLGLPNIVAGLLEDALVIASGLTLLSESQQ